MLSEENGCRLPMWIHIIRLFMTSMSLRHQKIPIVLLLHYQNQAYNCLSENKRWLGACGHQYSRLSYAVCYSFLSLRSETDDALSDLCPTICNMTASATVVDGHALVALSLLYIYKGK